ncbi:fibrinogen-like protein 1 [Gigantopelta aegis]|uniref:fibrinogen-like protein 1 n=1 Tax=Gigantopelta aegis TaxID=1735272 RepID=UPI001B88DB03|nr:fibrinogen-like protein 1 [Gigantopelta aegis]
MTKMSAMLLKSVLALSTITMCLTQDMSVCTSQNYRNLPTSMQNEHMCMVLERVHLDISDEKTHRDIQLNSIIRKLSRLENRVSRGFSRLAWNSKSRGTRMRGFPALRDVNIARDCNELQMGGVTLSGVYPLKLSNRNVVNVWCDMDTDSGGWTLIQRRLSGDVNFTRNWDDYMFGFGNVNSEYWLGLDNMYYLTRDTNYSLRIDMWDWLEVHKYAVYDYFRVGQESESFPLSIKGFNGTAGDSLSYHNGMKFSAMDKDNDDWWTSCSRKDRSGWWFKACHYSSLNGLYYRHGENNITPDGVVNGVIWYHFNMDRTYSLQKVEMKIKPRAAILEVKAKKALQERFEDSSKNKLPEAHMVPAIEDTL